MRLRLAFILAWSFCLGAPARAQAPAAAAPVPAGSAEAADLLSDYLSLKASTGRRAAAFPAPAPAKTKEEAPMHYGSIDAPAPPEPRLPGPRPLADAPVLILPPGLRDAAASLKTGAKTAAKKASAALKKTEKKAPQP